MPLLTFVIPVRHQDNASNWARLSSNLSQTLASIASQTRDDWQGVVVANEGAELPTLPNGFRVERVSFPPNRIHERGDATREDFLNAFRIDKGRRVLAGMLSAKKSQFFMVCDDDDFISRDIVSYVSKHPTCAGWKIDRGYVWGDGGPFLYALDDFNLICGTSLIIRADIYNLPDKAEDADQRMVMDMLGSHRDVDRRLRSQGVTLTSLPFRGAVYRVGHPGSHSKAPGILRKFVLTPGWKRRPLKVIRDLSRIRLLSSSHKQRFFGSSE